MKKRMYWSLCAISFLVLLLTTGLMLWQVYGLLLRQAKVDLADEHKLVAESIAYMGEDAQEYLASLNIRFDSFRITVIAPDGTVAFDSDNNSAGMENHLSRPEIARAFETGWGEDVRHSQTMGMDTYYYAERLTDGSVLRVSKQSGGIGQVFVSIVPALVAVLAAILAMGVGLSAWLTRKLLRPVEKLAEHPEDSAAAECYEELEPFFRKIREQNQQIRDQLETLRGERDTIRLITSNMKEGLVLLDLSRIILSVNRSALTLLNAPAGDYEGKSVLNLSRSAELSGCIDRALTGEGCDMVQAREGRAVQMFVSPVYHEDAVCGVIILILDVTEQQEAEKIRREFSANVSHELKTPLTSISGFAEMLENGMITGGEDVKKCAGRIYREANRLVTLTDDIIRLSRIEASGGLDVEPVDLLEVCENTVGALQFQAQQKQVDLQASGERLTVQGNPSMLDELVYNLVENAVKYNQPGGRVDIRLRRDANAAVLTVADTGIGIPKEHQERIFERFYRVDKSRSKQTGGTGLGLSIVKHIVERHKGTLTLESAQDAGTAITIRLPL